MMIKKVETFLVRVQEGKKAWISGIFKTQAIFLPAPTNPTKLAEKVYLSVLQHTTKFQAKI